MGDKTVLIIGAGPAGLTAASELAERGYSVLVAEADAQVGGISKTVRYRGNRMDIGGHRFFSKSDEVMRWWLGVLPLQGRPSRDDIELGRQIPVSDAPEAPDPEVADEVMLSRTRLSRIYFLRRFFDYPVSLSGRTIANLGLARVARIGASYLMARLRPIRPERSLEDFMVNRFGRELYSLFFRDYTEKVWGVPCSRIRPEWGAQRIKGLSIGKAILHALRAPFRGDGSISQKGTETSLISRFLYPKFGPGQLWEAVARRVRDAGGEVRLGWEAVELRVEDGAVTEVVLRDAETGDTSTVRPDSVVSSMPVRDLVERMAGTAPPADVARVAAGLPYRDFMTAGLLVRRLAVTDAGGTLSGRVLDNWIYIQEREVRLGRLQIFNNWSPYMVADPGRTWLGLEYFCDEGDELWTMPDEEFLRMAAEELASIGIIDAADVVDGTALRVRKAYPAYFGTYAEFDVVRRYLDTIDNLYLVGRNGMHRYNNMDHSMLSAIAAARCISGEGATRADVWSVNAEEEYHEER